MRPKESKTQRDKEIKKEKLKNRSERELKREKEIRREQTSRGKESERWMLLRGGFVSIYFVAGFSAVSITDRVVSRLF